MDHAKRMRTAPTDAEHRLWQRLRNRQLGFKFRRQHRVGGYIVDLVCVETGVVIEVDGGQHVELAGKDAERTAYLESVGLRVLRFWNDDVLLRTDAVVDAIWHALQERPPHPNPLPRRRGRGGGSQSQSQSYEQSNEQNPTKSREQSYGQSGSQKDEQGRARSDVQNQTQQRSQQPHPSDHQPQRPSPASASQSGAAYASAPSPPLAGERVGVRGPWPYGVDPALLWAPSASGDALRLRARLNALIRAFFAERDVLEVETPILSQAGNTDPNIASFSLEFGGHVDAGARQRWLRTSPEFPLKRLLAAGMGDCYELGRVFRDGEAGGRHNPEFTMLEWYRIGWDHQRLIGECAALLAEALALVGRTAALTRISYRDLYRQRLGIDPIRAPLEQLQAALGDIRIDPQGLQRDDWLDLLMTHRLQPEFASGQLLAVYDYPASQCALARLRDDGDIQVAERFELYLGPLELANGYHELADAREQRARFLRDIGTRSVRGVDAPAIDESLLAALDAGFPDCAGVALGVDRLLMAMLDSARIADTLAFDFSRA